MIEYTIETSLHLLEIRVENSVSILDFVNLLTNLSKDPQYGPSLKTLFIVDTDARLANLMPEFVSSFFQRVEASSGPVVWAIVLPDETHKSIFSRALQSYVPKRIRLRLFEEEFPALQWLKLN